MIEPSSHEQAWESILSRNPEAIRKAFSRLDEPARQAVLAHLRKMVTESGWHPEQVISAQAALEALKNIDR